MQQIPMGNVNANASKHEAKSNVFQDAPGKRYDCSDFQYASEMQQLCDKQLKDCLDCYAKEDVKESCACNPKQLLAPKLQERKLVYPTVLQALAEIGGKRVE